MQALRRPRILLWVGQQSKATVDQRRVDCHLQDRYNFVPRRSWVVLQPWKQSSSTASLSRDKEAERATRELVPPASSSSSSSVSERSDELATKRLVPLPKIQIQNEKDWQDQFGRPAGRSSWVVGQIQRNSERNWIACIHTQFSGIRSRISYESGNKITLLRRPRLRRMLGNQDTKGLLAEDALAKLYLL